MKEVVQSPYLARFESFEVNLRSGELCRNGERIKLPEQSFQILAMLLERRGEVVMRQEIQKRLWPNDTVVEFENSINAAIRRLRVALGDSADQPRYIDTLARRGYRWKVPVEWIEPSPAEPQAPTGAGASPPVDNAASRLIGKRVSHYRVLEILGGGGMGMVYKAEDIKLGRRVALKFLPEELAEGSGALERFEREARAASALNHPNICTIYEVEEHEGQPFIVMELLEGQTLRELISSAQVSQKTRAEKGRVPLKRLLDVGLQIAAGLDASHKKGIIHRDIKPANIFVTTNGQVKILDFGLAKLQEAETANPEPSHVDSLQPEREGNPYLTLTRTGTTIGTAGYMSPEQIRGEKLDARTDLFSFGLVLYEMAVGEKAFTGETAAVIQAAIVSQIPAPVRELNPEIPAKLESLITKALEKDRPARYQSASDIRADLEALKRKIEPRTSLLRDLVVGAFILLLAVVAIWFAKRQRSTSQMVPETKIRQLTFNSFENRVSSGAISPDGKYLAYADVNGMYIKLLGTGEVRAIPEPEGFNSKNVQWELGAPGSPAAVWFPDSARFAANAHPATQNPELSGSEDTSIWVVSVLGRSPYKVRDRAVAYAVSPVNFQIAFLAKQGREMWVMGPNGEQAKKIYQTAADSSIAGMLWIPDGRRIMYGKQDQTGGITILSRDLEGGPEVTLLPISEMKTIDDVLPWLPDGRLLYTVRDPGDFSEKCKLWTMRLDPRTGQFIDTPKQVTNSNGYCMPSSSTTADGKRLAFLTGVGHATSYVADLQANGARISNITHFPLSESSDGLADWIDSETVVNTSNRTGVFGIYKQRLGEEAAEPLVTEGYGRNPRVTPDGKWMLYLGVGDTTQPPDTRSQPVMRVPIGGGTSQKLFIARPNAILDCARSRSNLCVIGEESDDRKQLVVTSVDPMRGRGSELFRFPLDPKSDSSWYALSLDGTRIAATRNQAGPIYILSLRGQSLQEIMVKGWSNLQEFTWAADGKGLYVPAKVPGGDVLLYVNLQGNARVLWRNPGASGETLAHPSPDGRHLAIQTLVASGNMWIMEDF